MRKYASDTNKMVNKFYKSKNWLLKKEEIKTRDKGMCQRCLIKFERITIDHLEVHHNENLTSNWEKRLDNENLVC